MKFEIKSDAPYAESGGGTSEGSRAPGSPIARAQAVARAVPIWGWAAGGVVFAFAAVFVFTQAARPPEVPKNHEQAAVATVSVAVAAVRPVNGKLTVTGSISPWDPLSIGAEVVGLRIDSVLVEEGDHVKTGQTLATLNSSVLRGSLAEARARLSASEAHLAKARQPNRPEEISALRAAVAGAEANVSQEESNLVEAKANLENAEHNAVRYADLVKQGAVSAQDAENRHTTALTARANVRAAEQRVRASKFVLDQAKNKLKMAEIGGRSEDVEITRATIAEMRAVVERLEAQVAQTIIKAPDDGLITKRDAHIGDITAMNKPLFSMARDNRLELRALVAESDLGKAKAGQSVEIATAGDQAMSIKGVVREISPMVDTNSRLGTVRIDVPSTPGLKTGMFVRGEVDLGTTEAITVPARAVLTRDGRTFVLLLDGNRVKSKDVVTGARSGDLIQIVSGVNSGDTVIVAGAGFLKDGDSVRVAP